MLRRRLILAIAATLLIATIIGCFIVTRESRDLQRYRRIQVGMQLADVKRLFPNHEPTLWIDPNDNSAAWGWHLDEIDIMVCVDTEQRVTDAHHYQLASDSWVDGALRRVGLR
jgi:hypothetical protein